MVSLEDVLPDLVTLRFTHPYEDADEPAYLDALKRISDRSEPFVLLAVFGGGGKLSQAGERAQALWYKATRDRMNDLCRGLAMVRPGAGEAMAAPFRKLWRFPIAVSEDVESALAFLSDLRRAA